MKKMLRRIVTLAIVATMFVMPTATAFADSNSYPVVICDAGGTTIMEWQPALQVDGDGLHTYFMDDMSNIYGGYWSVPAGKTFYFQVSADDIFRVRVRIFKNDVMVSDYVTIAYYDLSFNIDPENQNNNWRISITPLSYTTIRSHTGIIY